MRLNGSPRVKAGRRLFQPSSVCVAPDARAANLGRVAIAKMSVRGILLLFILLMVCARCDALAQARVVVNILDFFNSGAQNITGGACDTRLCDTYFKYCLASSL